MKLPKIADSVLDLMGKTPMIRMRRLEKLYGLNVRLYAKCENFNPGGSLKDRIGASMIDEAERMGKIKPGGTLIEATSGNTGIGLILAAT